MASTKKGDYTVLVLFVVVSAALLSILFLKQDTPTGYAVFDGNLDVLKGKVEQFVRTMPLTALAGDGAEVCLIIYDNENAYTFDLFKSNGQVEVTYNPYSRYCDNDINDHGREDFVIQYIDYESFLSHAADPACELLKSTGAGQDFYYLPSEFMQQGGVPVCNDLFKERY
ncbi:hypothetical protein HYU19_01995, partial [Candidatus Woesearchaeota archaeon]|nr:hypothetical protein [Candidatus Woesearchaeota archaeon]